MPDEKREKSDKFVDSLLCAYFMSVAASYVAEMHTFPLDLTKTRMQIQGEANIKDTKMTLAPHRGMFRTMVGIVKEEGPFQLWQGCTAALARHTIYSGLRIVFYRALRENIFVDETEEYLPVWKSAFYGATAGMGAQYFANPPDLIKVQLQMEGKRKMMGLPVRVKNFRDAFQQVINKAGVTGLWKGAVPNLYRAALVNIGDLSTYDLAKRFLLRHTSLGDKFFVHLLSSIAAGFVAAVMGTPADVVKTRVMNQPLDKDGRGLLYKNGWDCVKKTVRNEHFFALYKGFFPIWFRMAPWALIFWVSYEQFNRIVGAHQF